MSKYLHLFYATGSLALSAEITVGRSLFAPTAVRRGTPLTNPCASRRLSEVPNWFRSAVTTLGYFLPVTRHQRCSFARSRLRGMRLEYPLLPHISKQMRRIISSLTRTERTEIVRVNASILCISLKAKCLCFSPCSTSTAPFRSV